MHRCLKAAGYLSGRIFAAVRAVDGDFLASVCEIRLRSGKPLSFITFNGIFYLTATGRITEIPGTSLFTVSGKDIKESFQRLCQFSVYSYSKEISEGFITVEGGHRAGVYGTAVYEKGELVSFRDTGGINLRIAREYKGCGKKLSESLFSNGIVSFLLCGAPSTGKTTLLRDISRIVSDDYSKKVAVIDERSEIAAVSKGTAQNNVGINTDVLDGYIKSKGIIQAVRTLSPDIIICDEIGTAEDAAAVMSGVNSGIKFAAAVHAADEDELRRKAEIMRLAEYGAFEKAVFLKSNSPCRLEKIIKTEDLMK